MEATPISSLLGKIRGIGNILRASYQAEAIAKLIKEYEGFEFQSVLQDWVMTLPLRAQGTLLTAVRGCDLTPKLPLNSPERKLVSCIRGAFMVPADPRELDAEPGCFMSLDIPTDFRWSGIGHYPQHWVAHILHAVQVIGYCHPRSEIAASWRCIYLKGCHSLHLKMEDIAAFEHRMNEDRIANNNIVS